MEKHILLSTMRIILCLHFLHHLRFAYNLLRVRAKPLWSCAPHRTHIFFTQVNLLLRCTPRNKLLLLRSWKNDWTTNWRTDPAQQNSERRTFWKVFWSLSTLPHSRHNFLSFSRPILVFSSHLLPLLIFFLFAHLCSLFITGNKDVAGSLQDAQNQLAKAKLGKYLSYYSWFFFGLLFFLFLRSLRLPYVLADCFFFPPRWGSESQAPGTTHTRSACEE